LSLEMPCSISHVQSSCVPSTLGSSADIASHYSSCGYLASGG
jgi:hypothetical protein